MLSRGDEDRGRARRLWPLLLLLLIAAACAGLSVWRPWQGSGPVAGPPPSGTPDASATTARCPAADLTGVGGTAAYWRRLVEPVHQAACAGDFTALSRLLGGGDATDFLTEECNGCTSSEIVTMWRDEYGLNPASLAGLLETPPVVGQGGLVYAHGDLAAIFARGTHDIPGVWSGFFLRCGESPECAALQASG